MTKATFFEKVTGKFGWVEQKHGYVSKILNPVYKTVIKNVDTKTSRIRSTDYSVTKITSPSHSASFYQPIPFKIKLTNIGISGYGSSNAPGIGIQVIGFSNYIL